MYCFLHSPIYKPPHGLLDEDDLVSDARVPLDLQLHVVMVLKRQAATSKESSLKLSGTQESNLVHPTLTIMFFKDLFL